MKGKTAGKIIALFAVAGMLAGCGEKQVLRRMIMRQTMAILQRKPPGTVQAVHSRIPHRARQGFRKKI